MEYARLGSTGMKVSRIRRISCPFWKRSKQARQPLDALNGEPLVNRQDEDTISQPGGVRKSFDVHARGELLPVGSHIHAVPEQPVSPAVAVLGYQRQSQRTDAVRQHWEYRAGPGQIVADLQQAGEVPSPPADHSVRLSSPQQPA